MKFFHMQKWYFDCINPDDDAVYIYLIIFRAFGIKFNRIAVHLASKGVKPAEYSYPVKIKNFSDSGEMIFSGGFLRRRRNGYQLKAQLGELNLDLVFTDESKSWNPHPQNIIRNKSGGYLNWRVPQPRAKVEGLVEFLGRKINLSGIGYQDIVETNIALWKLPIRELYWGRVHSEKMSAVFDVVKFTDGSEYKILHLLKGRNPIVGREKTGSNFEFSESLFDTSDFLFRIDETRETANLEADSANLKFENCRILVSEPVLTDNRIKMRSLRKFIGSLSGNPFEEKFLADAKIDFQGTAIKGKAIFERVVWNKSGEQNG